MPEQDEKINAIMTFSAPHNETSLLGLQIKKWEGGDPLFELIDRVICFS